MKSFNVHKLSDLYSKNTTTGLQNGKAALVVHEPRTLNRFLAAWHVLIGNAEALEWPKPGDLEEIFYDH